MLTAALDFPYFFFFTFFVDITVFESADMESGRDPNSVSEVCGLLLKTEIF